MCEVEILWLEDIKKTAQNRKPDETRQKQPEPNLYLDSSIRTKKYWMASTGVQIRLLQEESGLKDLHQPTRNANIGRT